MAASGGGGAIRKLGTALMILGGAALLIALLFLSGAVKLTLTGTEAPPLGTSPAVAMGTPTPVPASASPTASEALPMASLSVPTAIPSPSPTRMPEAKPAPTATPPSPAVRIAIPRLGIEAKVVEMGWTTDERGMAEWVIPDYAAGHAINSAHPGEIGNVVISGHHNISGEVFKGLWNAVKGDEVFLEAADGRRFRYVVDQNALILPEKDATEEERRGHARYMDQTQDSRVTLISCWPYSSNTHRVIVIGLLAP